MAPIAVSTQPFTHTVPQSSPLSGDPSDWPFDARDTRRQVLSQLDAWCRTHDAPKTLNSWVAEEAVRQSW